MYMETEVRYAFFPYRYSPQTSNVAAMAAGGVRNRQAEKAAGSAVQRTGKRFR
jgi:hypothetical protein